MTPPPSQTSPAPAARSTSSLVEPHDLGTLCARLGALGMTVRVEGGSAMSVRGVCDDSRRVAEGDLFVAMQGTRSNGADYVAQARDRGAAAVLCSTTAERCGLPALRCAEPERVAGVVAALLYGDPSSRLALVGVTGTNGKTSTTYILESIWRAAGARPGVMGTVAVRCASFERAAALTTPGPVEIQHVLAEMAAAGCDCVAMEVSSHALDQHRVAGCHFRAGVFTNLTRDHLDYHADEESYFRAKALLFRDYLARSGGAQVLNLDDPYSARLAAEVDGDGLWTFSSRGAPAARVAVIASELDLDGIRARLRVGDATLDVRTRLIGPPNLDNLVAAAATAAALGVPSEAIARGIEQCAAVPGRLERIGTERPVVVVDYAHTPDALIRVLNALRPAVERRLIVVFGCGGDRDRGKRRLMGEAAAKLADVAVVTSDNPRTEEPDAIITDIVEGMYGVAAEHALEDLAKPLRHAFAVQPDRRAAIAAALAVADAGDVVVVAGKGHEDYQEIHGRRFPFDDRVVVRELLAPRSPV